MFACERKMSETRFLWVNMTPFGVPVVPEVKRICAISSSPHGSGSTYSALLCMIHSAGPFSSRHATAFMGSSEATFFSLLLSVSIATESENFASRMKSSSLNALSKGTTVAPANMTAKYPNPHATLFFPLTMTLSPFLIPELRSQEAIPFTMGRASL